MSWFTRLFNRLTKDPQPQDARVVHFGRTQAGEFITSDTALQNAVVWACVTYLGRTVGQLPWRVMTEDADGVKQRVPTHPVDYLLSRRPCPEYPPLAWRETMVGWAARYGNAIAEIVRDQRGLAASLYPIHPERTTPRRSLETGELVWQVTSENGPVRVLSAMDVFHIRGYGEGPIGLDVMSYAAQSIGWAQATQMFGASFFGNGLNPTVVVETPAKLTLDGFKMLRASLDTVYKGPRNSNKPFIADGGMKVSKLSSTAEEAQFIETRQHQVAEMCRWFGVPPHKVMDLLRGTFSNIEHQSIEVVVDCITPWALRFEQEADFKLFGPANKQGYFTRMDLKGLLRGDFKSRQEGLAIMRQWGIVSGDEWRALEDMNPIKNDGGDKYIVPLNFTTLEKVGEDVAPPPVAPVPPSNVVNISPPAVTFNQGDLFIPKGMVDLHVTTPEVQNHVTLQPPEVHVQAGNVTMPDVKVDNHFAAPENNVQVDAPVVHVRAGDVTMPDVRVDNHYTQPEVQNHVTIEPAQVTVKAGDVNMPLITVNTPEVVNNVTVESAQAPQVTITNEMPKVKKQHIKRDAQGDIMDILNTYEAK